MHVKTACEIPKSSCAVNLRECMLKQYLNEITMYKNSSEVDDIMI